MKSEVLRLVAGGLLALISCYIGLLIKRKYTSRVTFYKSACAFCYLLEDELSMRKTPMPEIASKFLSGRKGAFEDVLTDWGRVKSVDLTNNDKCRLLKNEEAKDMSTFLNMLGKTDLKDQLAHVEHYKRTFEKKTAECEEQSKKLGSMYFKLCVLLGLAIILILA